MANSIPNAAKVNVFKGSIAPLTDTIRCALLNSSFVAAPTTQQFFSDVNANEISGSGYTAGGIALTTKTITQDNVNNRAVLGADNVVWNPLTGTNIAFAVIYKDTGTPSTSPIIAILDLGGAQTQTGASFTVAFPASGVAYIG